MTTLAPPRPVTRLAAPPERRAFAAVVRRSLRDHRRSPLTWGISLGLMSALELAIYPSVEKSLSKMMDSYPDALKQAFRMESISSPAQFLNGEMYSLVIPLAVAFFAIRAATRPIVGAEERHWLDAILAAPLRRRTLVAGAFAGSAITTAAILLVASAIAWIAGLLAGATVGADLMLAGAAAVWAISVFFAGFAVLLCGRSTSHAAVTAGGAGLLVAMYVLDVTSRIADWLEPAGPASAFHYYGSAMVDGLSLANFAGTTAVGLLLALAGLLLFERRDIHG